MGVVKADVGRRVGARAFTDGGVVHLQHAPHGFRAVQVAVRADAVDAAAQALPQG